MCHIDTATRYPGGFAKHIHDCEEKYLLEEN